MRHLGNAAAHGGNIEFSSTQNNKMVKYTKFVVGYILPKKISKLQNINES